MATRIINRGGTWKEFTAAMGLEQDLPYQLKWNVESMTTYDLIIGLMEFSGAFARWESGECPRNSHPTLWTPKNPPVDPSGDVHMGVAGQGSGGEGQGGIPSGVAASDGSMDRGITRASVHVPGGMTHRPSGAPLAFAREHQLPPSTASQGIIAASASGANSRITKVEEDIHGLRHDVAGLRHQIDRLDQGSLSTQMSLSLLLENAGFTKEKIQERMAVEQAALSAARGDLPSVPSSS